MLNLLEVQKKTVVLMKVLIILHMLSNIQEDIHIPQCNIQEEEGALEL